MIDTRQRGFVVADVSSARGMTSMSFLTIRGRSIDPIKTVTGERDWTPILGQAVEVFPTKTEAVNVAGMYGGGVLDYERAQRYDAILRETWTQLHPSTYREGDRGL
jgi:hypothetical protein